MRPDRNPLDLNNLPDDYTTSLHYSKHTPDDTSSSAGPPGGGNGGAYKKKKNGAAAKDDSSKIYQCRFCSLKFCKSQALGGHMNRHRQERENETLNRARQLVFTNDNILAPPPTNHHLGSGISGFHHQTGEYRPLFPRLIHDGPSSVVPPQQQQQPYMYTPHSRLVPNYQQPHYPQHVPVNDYYIGHILPGSSSQFGQQNQTYMAGRPKSNYTCVGAPVRTGFLHHHQQKAGQGMTHGGGSGDVGMQQRANNDEGEGLLGLNANINININNSNNNNNNSNNRGRSYTGTHQQLMDSSLINRNHDGF